MHAHLHAHIHALVDTFIQPVIETQTSERTHEIVLFVSPKMTSSLKKKEKVYRGVKGIDSLAVRVPRLFFVVGIDLWALVYGSFLFIKTGTLLYKKSTFNIFC